MTLAQALNWLGNQPLPFLIYFAGLPLLALLLFWVLEPTGAYRLRYLYSALVFASVVPGVFCITLNLALYFFERQSILGTNLLTQWLPIISMFLTLVFIRKKIAFSSLPGFGTLNSLLWIVFASFAILWLADKTRIYIVSFLPLWQALLVFAGLFLIIQFAWKRLVR